jgi:hypothetical protein
LELVLEQVKPKTKDKKDRADRLEQGLIVAYEKIPNSMQTKNLMTTKMIDQIVKTIDRYK